ncbi:MAG: polysaccharide biosynthesis protein [Firmicutes bacterium]|nr:polysaccharide biosynthesis protein [Bacillota bacterium]
MDSMGTESRSASFQQQAVTLMVSTLIVRFLGWAYRVWMTGIVGDSGMGFNGAAYYIYMFILIFSSAGLPAAISKMVSERVAMRQYKEAHRVFQTALVIAAIFGAAGSLLLVLTARALSSLSTIHETYYSLIALSPTILIAAISAVYRGYFQGMHNTVPTAVSQVTEQLFNAIFSVVFAFILVKGGQEYGAAGGSIGTGIGAAAGVLIIVGIYQLLSPYIKKRITSPFSSRVSLARPINLAGELLRTAWPIIIGMAVYTLSNLVDIFLVPRRLTASGAFTYDQITSMYGILTNKYASLITMPVSFSTAVAVAAVPNIASAVKLRDADGVNAKINDGLRLSMLLSIPAAIGLTVLGNPIIRMLYPSFPDGGVLMEFGSISIIFLAVTQTVTGMLQGIGKVKIPVLGALAGVAVKIIFNYILIAIPSVNVVGAVISTTLCYVVAGAVNVYFLRKYTRARLDVNGAFLKPLGASAVMGLVCYVFYYTFYYISGSNAAAALLSIALGAAVYFFLMAAVGGIDAKYANRIPLVGKMVRKVTGMLR